MRIRHGGPAEPAADRIVDSDAHLRRGHRVVGVGLHRDHRRGERGERPGHLRPAGGQGGCSAAEAGQRAADRGADVESGGLGATGRHSIRATTPGFDNRYIRHADGLGYTAVVDAAASDLLKQDATWTIVPGLIDSSCYSFESVNYPGEYLRHQPSGLSGTRVTVRRCSRPTPRSAPSRPTVG